MFYSIVAVPVTKPLIRRNARWQRRLDERIPETLDEELLSTPEMLAIESPMDATENQVKDRCNRLADAKLIDVDLEDAWRVELTVLGKRYLEGETDMKYHRWPRWVRTIDAEVLKATNPIKICWYDSNVHYL